MMEFTIYALVIIATALLLSGWFFARVVIYPRRFGVKETYDLEKDCGKLVEADYNSWTKEELWIDSEFGYSIHGLYFPVEGANRTVIFSHGITYTLYGSVKYMKIFRDLGFNALIYDNRYHGQSGGKNCTFGYYEKYDLNKVVTWITEKTGSKTVIGTHGESMGAAISLQHATIDSRIKFAISDCSFSDLQDQLAYRLKIEYHLPRFPFIPLAAMMCKIISGMDFEMVSPRTAVSQISAPVFFIHGAEDDFIPVSMAEELYECKKNGPRELFIAPAAKHAESYWSNPMEYANRVRAFLKENKLI